MKKILAIALVLSMALTLLAACGGSSSTAPTSSSTEATSSEGATGEKTTLDTIIENGYITVATDAAWAPFEYIGENGDVTGSDLELAKHIAKELGVELKVINAAFDTLTTYLMNGEADMILAAMTITEERKETVDFSDAYTNAEQYIVVLEDSTVATIEDLAGATVGVHLGTTGDFLISDEVNMGTLMGKNTTVNQYKILPDAALAMKNGDLSAIVCDTLMAKNLAAVNEGFKAIPAVYADGTGTDELYGVAVAKGNTVLLEKINEILAPIVADGTIDGWIVEYTEKAAVEGALENN